MENREVLFTKINTASSDDHKDMAELLCWMREFSYSLPASNQPLWYHMTEEPLTPEALDTLKQSLDSPDTIALTMRTSLGKIGAYALAEYRRDAAGELTGVVELINLMVLPWYQRLGIGSMLLSEVEARIGAGFTVEAGVYVCPRTAVPFYKRKGYSESRIVRWDDLDAEFVIMEKKLEGAAA